MGGKMMRSARLAQTRHSMPLLVPPPLLVLPTSVPPISLRMRDFLLLTTLGLTRTSSLPLTTWLFVVVTLYTAKFVQLATVSVTCTGDTWWVLLEPKMKSRLGLRSTPTKMDLTPVEKCLIVLVN